VASKKQTIVIKKIIVQGGGHHGGSWKVALADFMTALMAFFLVMWLVGQKEETKKSISDYFSTPSMIEYNFQNFGAEITLEKLFLDMVNEPLKAFQSFLEPADRTPNVLDMGSAKVVAAFMADKMTDSAKNVTVSQDGFEFDIPDTYLFERGSANLKAEFIDVMEKLTAVTSGLEDSEVKLTSALFIQLVPEKTESAAQKIAQERLDLVRNKISASFEHSTNIIKGALNVRDKKDGISVDKLMGFIRVSIKQKERSDTNRKYRPLSNGFGSKDSTKNIYENFAKQAVQQKNRDDMNTAAATGFDPNLSNPVDSEVIQINNETSPDAEAQSE
jgi:chemotaxis protein MotB